MNAPLKGLIQAYDRAAYLYDLMNRLYFLGKDTRFRTLLVQQLVPYHSVLNLCCGTGLDFPILQKQMSESGRIVGVDLSVQMLQHAKEKRLSDIDLVRADIAHLPFTRSVFHAVLTTFCLTITPNPEGSVREIRRVLTSSGRLGILANHQPISLIPKLIAKAIGVMAHITYQLDLETLLTTSFQIIQKRILYHGLVQLFVGEPRARVNGLE
jgi:demethylmenaquinone methyltransferase/2-methoxy-6-polyprenyl-1,4-benzoquinol methylase